MRFSKTMTRFLRFWFLLASVYVPQVEAHDTKNYLSTSPNAKDQFLIACTGGNSSTRMVAAIQDFLPVNGPILSITVEKDGASVTSVEVKNRDGKWSPFVELPGGEGAYVFTIQKAKGNAAALKRKMIYIAQYHCMTGADHTETGDALFQQNN